MRNLIAFTMLAVSPAAVAQHQHTAPDREHTRMTKITFEEGDIIDGSLDQPDVEMVVLHERVEHESLLRLRTDFRDEVLASVSEL